jgi:LPS O-antigen subunit length determinant protein (WzzB/FepE family)
MTPLPSIIAELQDLAARIQEDAEAVRTEAREKLDARREKIRTHLSERMERLESNLQKAAEKGGADFVAFRDQVKSDRQRLKDKLGERKEARRAFFADASDEDRQLGAAIAVDYAIATVQQARLAVLDAVSDRAEARSEEPVG